jgi:hypothetical protein
VEIYDKLQETLPGGGKKGNLLPFVVKKNAAGDADALRTEGAASLFRTGQHDLKTSGTKTRSQNWLYSTQLRRGEYSPYQPQEKKKRFIRTEPSLVLRKSGYRCRGTHLHSL